MRAVAGGIVWNPKRGVVVVNQHHNSWSLPKGHIEKGETPLLAALREIEEETGIPQSALLLQGKLGEYERTHIKKNPDDPTEPEGTELRHISIFLFTTNHETLHPNDKENPEARWVPIDEVSTLLTHPKDKEFFESIKPKIAV